MSAEPLSIVERAGAQISLRAYGPAAGGIIARYEATVRSAEERADALRAAMTEAVRYLDAARDLTSDEPKGLIDDARSTLAHFLAADDAKRGEA